jgi:hypothetical protein
MDEVAELEVPTQENARIDLRSVFQGAIRVVLELVLDEELREMPPSCICGHFRSAPMSSRSVISHQNRSLRSPSHQ